MRKVKLGIIGIGNMGSSHLQNIWMNTNPEIVVTAVADTLAKAISEAYRITDGVNFKNAYRRSDIGQRGLAAYK